MSQSTSSTNTASFVDGWTCLFLAALIVLSALRPISNDDFWWQLSRGRAVMNGELSSGRGLLAGDVMAEADWLGGVPWYLIYTLTGLNGLMAWKITVVIGLVIWAWQGSRHLRPGLQWIAIFGLSLIASQIADLSPVQWDVLGLLICSALLTRLRQRFTARWLIALGAVVCTWSNLAPGCLWILLLVLLSSLPPLLNDEDSKEGPLLTLRQRAIVSIVAMLSICFTPRGLMTFWDSARRIMPMLVESQEILCKTEWHPVWAETIDPSVVGWLIIAIIALISFATSGKNCPAVWLLFAAVVSLSCWSRPNISVASVLLLNCTWTITRATVSSAMSPTPIQAPIKGAWPVRAAMTVLLTLVGLTIYSGTFLGNSSRLGWGLDRRLEQRLFADSIRLSQSATRPIIETAHCTDIRAAGMLAWNGGSIKPYLVAHRALINARLRDEVLLNQELEVGWLKYHRRSDGTAGGWWLPLRIRQTALVVLSAERTILIQSLQPTIWKPLSIDSPVLAHALAGDPRFSRRVHEIQSQRELVDRGAWTFTPEAARGNDQLLDVAGWATGYLDDKPTLRQSAVLRAMNMPLAATRVLRPLLSHAGSRHFVRREFANCQLDLARREFLTIGQVGEFRMRVLDAIGQRSPVPILPAPQPSNPSANDAAAAIWNEAVTKYLEGDPYQAAQLLDQKSAEALAAIALLKWESGRLDESRAAWNALRRRYPTSRYSLAARIALEHGEY